VHSTLHRLPSQGAASDEDSEEEDDDIEINLVAAPGGAETTPQFKSWYGYTKSANKYVRPGLEKASPAVTGTDGAGGEDEDENFDEQGYATLTDAGASEAWQSPAGQKAVSPTPAAAAALAAAFAVPSGASSCAAGGGGGDDFDAAAKQASAIASVSAAAPSLKGFCAIPADGGAATGFALDVREVPDELLAAVALPGPGRFVRTAFDTNLAGLDHRPWRDLGPPLPAAPLPGPDGGAPVPSGLPPRAPGSEAFFNFGLDELVWTVYARRQREARLALSRCAACAPEEDGVKG